jgi:uncharacterized protein
MRYQFLAKCAVIIGYVLSAYSGFAADPIQIVFLGDKGHHRPSDFAGRIAPTLKARGIDIEYTEDTGVLSDQRLKDFDGLLVYANIDEISREQEVALLRFVESGKGFIPIHCATYCFRNSEAYIALCGAQFKSHGGEVFETVTVAPEHPIMKGYRSFRSWDETYVHTKHNDKARTVLEVRRQGKQADGQTEEPWTWVRTHGKGRVFYTAWGHDARTWNQPGFHNLLERGIRWAVGSDPSIAGEINNDTLETLDSFPVPKMTPFQKDVKPFTYTDVGPKIPNYTVSKTHGTQGAPKTLMQDPLPPEESIKHYITPEGFSMALFTSEPNLQGKPIAMNWDERGRLWVCETYDYPNELQPGGEGRDRIRICEDTNRDGKADKFTVFAEKLSIPTAIEFYRGGAIVQDGTKTIYLKDIDGDDKADLRQELITGWALGDTHGGVSNFHYGHDNWFWAMQGYNASTPVINGVPQQGFRMGFWRFRVEKGEADATAPVSKTPGSQADASKFNEHAIRVKEVEFVRATSNNTWGFGMSEEGLIFGSTANGNPSNFMPIANRYYERVKGWSPSTLKMISDTHMFAPATDKVRQVDWHGGYTAAAGHALYTARKYPREWWNRIAFVCEPTGHLVGSFVLERNGANYKSTSPFNLVASDDEWASPIMAEVGPDGNMWVIDWYNFIVQHNPTPKGFQTGQGNAYESDLRDKKHGRVYRVVYEGKQEPLSQASQQAESIASKGLDKASDAELVQVLYHPTMRWRLLAQRLLAERASKGSEATMALEQLLGSNNAQDSLAAIAQAHGLAVLTYFAASDSKIDSQSELAASALKSTNPSLRLAAIRTLSVTTSGKTLVDAKLLNDPDLQVLLAAFLKLADLQGNQDDAVGKALSEVDATTIADNWLLDGWTAATAHHAQSTLPHLLSSSKAWPIELRQRIEIVARHLARSEISGEALSKIVTSLEQVSPDKATTILQGFDEGWPSDYRVTLSESASRSLASLLENLPLGGKSLVAKLAKNWGAKALDGQVEKIVNALLADADKASNSDNQRIEAAKLLVSLQSNQDSPVEKLMTMITPQTSPRITDGFLLALQGSTSSKVAPTIIDRFSSFGPQAKATAVRVLMARQESTLAMLDSVKEGKIVVSDLQLDQRQALRDHPNRRVRELAQKVMSASGGVVSADRVKLVEEWTAICEQKGDALRGKQNFTKYCANCHQHTGEGQNIGPDLTGMAVHPKHELLTHILDPNRSVEGNFRVYAVMTVDGIVLTGMLAGESRTSIEIIDAQGKRQSIQRDDIEQLVSSRKSLMPEGFESQLDKNAMNDLLEFLTTKGKYVPISLAKVATAISTKGLFHDGDQGPDRMVFPDWKTKRFKEVPFVLVDPQDKRINNIVLLNGPNGTLPPKMPKSVTLPCNMPAAAIHLLSGVSGWGFPASKKDSVSMIVRFRYEDGQTEEHPLLNGVHFADYIRRVDVPGSEFMARLGTQQIRYLKVEPKRNSLIKEIELVKGADDSSPIVMGVTIETK